MPSTVTKRGSLLLLLILIAPSPGLAPDWTRAAPAWSLLWDNDWVTAVCFLGPNRLAAGNNLGQILIWNLPDKAGGTAPLPTRLLRGHSNTINRLVAGPDGRWLISASNDHTIRYWDLEASAGGAETITLNDRARDEAVARKRKAPVPVTVKVEVQEAAKILQGHKDWVLGLSLSRDGNLLVSGDDKGEVIVWDRPSGKELRRWKVKGWTWALALSPDGRTLAVSERLPLVFDSGRHAGLKIWDVTTGTMKLDPGSDKTLAQQLIAAAAFSPDGKHLAIARGGEIDGPNGTVTLLDPVSGKKLRQLAPGHLNGATDVIFSSDGIHLLSTGRDTLVRVWRVADGKLVKELGKARGGQFKDWFHSIAVAPNGQWLAAADMAGKVQVWSLPGK